MPPPAVAERAAASGRQLLPHEFFRSRCCAGAEAGECQLENGNAESGFPTHAFVHPLLLPLLPSVYAFMNPSWPPAPKKKRSLPTTCGGTVVLPSPTKSPTDSYIGRLATSQFCPTESSYPTRPEKCAVHSCLLRCARCDFGCPIKKRRSSAPVHDDTDLALGCSGGFTRPALPQTSCSRGPPRRLKRCSGGESAETSAVEMPAALFYSSGPAAETQNTIAPWQPGAGVCEVTAADDQAGRGSTSVQIGCSNSSACPSTGGANSLLDSDTPGFGGDTPAADGDVVVPLASTDRERTLAHRPANTGEWVPPHSARTPCPGTPRSKKSDLSEPAGDQLVCRSHSTLSMPATAPKREASRDLGGRLSASVTSPCKTSFKYSLLPSIGCGLTVSASSLGRGSGLGVYACRPYSSRSRVGEYAGVCVDRKVAMMLRGMGTSTHVMRVGMQYQYLVGYRLPFLFAGAGAFVNDGRWFADGRKGPGVSVRFHVAYDKKRAKDRVYVVATRDIEAGEEIFTSYDNQYWALLR